MSTTDSNLKETVSPSELTPAESSHEVPADTPTEPTPKKSRSLLIAILVLVIAVAVTVAILVRNQHLSQDLSQLQTSLSESQNKWKETAAKKEALQTELADVENNIREAQLTYDESTVKIADLTGQIETLTAQNASLENQLVIAADTESMYTRQAAAIRETMEVMKASNESLVTALKVESEYTGDLWQAMIDSRDQILSSLKTRKKTTEDALKSAKSQLETLSAVGNTVKADSVRAEILDLEKELAEINHKIRMYGTENDLNS